MTFFVLIEITVPRLFGIIFGRNAIGSTISFDKFTDCGTSISLVSHNNATGKRNSGKYINCHGTIIDIARSKVKLDRIA